MCFYHDDDEYAKVFRESVHKSKKQYKCDSCRRMIEPGEQYLRRFWIMGDGSSDTGHYCNQCVQDCIAIVRYEQRQGCEGSDAWPYLEHVHGLISRGDEDEDWKPEFPGDDSCLPHVLFWPYDVPPAVDPIDLRTIPEYAK